MSDTAIEEPWKPFFAYINDNPKHAIELGLTNEEASNIQWILNRLLAVAPEISLEEQEFLDDANLALDRRNLRPIADEEYGEIKRRES